MHEISATTMALRLFRKGCVTVKVNTLKKWADILTYLKKYDLPHDGTLPILLERLRNHLTNVAKRIGHFMVMLSSVLAIPQLEQLYSQQLFLGMCSTFQHKEVCINVLCKQKHQN